MGGERVGLRTSGVGEETSVQDRTGTDTRRTARGDKHRRTENDNEENIRVPKV
jgi:hypothetical protein